MHTGRSSRSSNGFPRMIGAMRSCRRPSWRTTLLVGDSLPFRRQPLRASPQFAHHARKQIVRFVLQPPLSVPTIDSGSPDGLARLVFSEQDYGDQQMMVADAKDRSVQTALLTVRQVGELLQVHPRTVWRLAAGGYMPRPITLSKKIVRWRLSDLEQFLEAQR